MVPITGMLVFMSPSVSLYKIFASPAVSTLTLKIVISVSLFMMLRVSQHVIVMSRPERSSGRLSRPGSPRVCPTRPGLAARLRLVFRVPVAQRFLLRRSIEKSVSRLLQLSYCPVSAFKLRRLFALGFSLICLFKSVLLGAVSTRLSGL